MLPNRLLALASLFLPALAMPFPLVAISRAANPVPRRYIVTLKEGISRSAHVSSIQSNIQSTSTKITHEFEIINGYAAELSTNDLNELRADLDVASIEEDSIFHTFDTKTQFVHFILHKRDLFDF